MTPQAIHEADDDRTVSVMAADAAGFAALQEVFGTTGPAARCQCQRYKLRPNESFSRQPAEVRVERLREQVTGVATDGATTCGLVASIDHRAVGWCAVEPRRNYRGLVRNQRVPWQGREEDREDPTVWALTCLFVRRGSRRRGVSEALVAGAVEAARSGGARALEAYPMTTTEALSDELHPGLLATFLAAGFTELARPTQRRAVVRLELQSASRTQST